jgi:hypothetical protein
MPQTGMNTFEARSSDDFFLGYANHYRTYHVLNLDINQIRVIYEVTFDETQPCSSAIFDSTGDDEIDEKILEDEKDGVGEDDGDDGEAPAAHVPSTSTTTTTVQDGPSPGVRCPGEYKLTILPQESSETSMSTQHS